jgi:hypothetical protein
MTDRSNPAIGFGDRTITQAFCCLDLLRDPYREMPGSRAAATVEASSAPVRTKPARRPKHAVTHAELRDLASVQAIPQRRDLVLLARRRVARRDDPERGDAVTRHELSVQ